MSIRAARIKGRPYPDSLGQSRWAKRSLHSAPLRRICTFGAVQLRGSAHLAPRWSAEASEVRAFSAEETNDMLMGRDEWP